MVRSEKRPRRVQETEETDSDVVHTDTEVVCPAPELGLRVVQPPPFPW